MSVLHWDVFLLIKTIKWYLKVYSYLEKIHLSYSQLQISNNSFDFPALIAK